MSIILKKTSKRKKHIENTTEVENTAKKKKRTKCQCDKLYTYCNPCNSKHWRDNFPNWTSGDDNIDKLIQKSQLGANRYKLLEWIEYSNFKNIEHVAEGGFAACIKLLGMMVHHLNMMKKNQN